MLIQRKRVNRRKERTTMSLLQAWIENLKEHRLEACEASRCTDHSIKGWPHPWTSELHDEEVVEVFVAECCSH